ncbi:MAG TPA: PspA/IM30 family protein [Myxococcota bacterium]|nr:PspA/IM30 family protein [Myxococcota bacterium]
MGVLSRINDIVRSNLNELVGKAENPEKLLSQAILDMEKHLRRARSQVIDTIAAEKTMEKKRLSVAESASRWERRAAMALRSGDEELARQAILRKNEFTSHAASLEEQIKVQREYVGALKQSLVSLDERYRDARNRKQALVARARAAKARKHSVRAMSPDKAPGAVAGSRAFDTFERMEDKVLAIEAQVEAYSEMAGSGAFDKEEIKLETRFASIENDREIENQLSELKKRVASDNKEKASD